jgi:hypothetical protein
MVAPYQAHYPGVWTMQWHDKDTELKRWFENWKTDCYASFASEHEWLVIEETPVIIGRRKYMRYAGTVGNDADGDRCKIAFELGAPAPPSFHCLPKGSMREYRRICASADLMYATEQRYLEDMLYGRRALRNPYHYGGLLGGIIRADEMPSQPPPPPPPPRYRRNA